jgi:hypothetical protein
MKPIIPESIPELKFLPIAVIICVVLGLIAAFLNRPKLFLAWAIIVSFLSLLGIYDFYLWEYDYGHTLSPDAPMKFPGASFQPPVIGTKIILNFVAESFPHTSGILAAISIFLAFVAGFLGIKKYPKNEISNSHNNIDANGELVHTDA